MRTWLLLPLWLAAVPTADPVAELELWLRAPHRVTKTTLQHQLEL